MGLLSWLGFGKRQKRVEELLARGAQIIDVRMAGEFKTGHISGSVNIPLEVIENKVEQIKHYNKPVITCCVSGMRSGVATRKLRKAGIEAINGGSWYGVKMVVDHQI
jgi:phage shock protein E